MEQIKKEKWEMKKGFRRLFSNRAVQQTIPPGCWSEPIVQRRFEKSSALARVVAANSLAAASLSALLESTGPRRMNDLPTEKNAPERTSTPDRKLAAQSDFST